MVGTPSSKEGTGESGPGLERFVRQKALENIERMNNWTDPRGRNHLGYRKEPESQRIN
jgi:hypothetical protein